MKTLIAITLVLASAGGCVVEEEHHHGRVAVVESSHRHGPGCGHVYVKGVWYEER